jgi:hypothetical protein
MILTRSPYYKTIPWNNPAGQTPPKYILQIYIWSGPQDSIPDLPTHEIKNINPLGLVGSMDVNISPYINDVLKFNLTKSNSTDIIAANSAVWVKTQVIYYNGATPEAPELITIDLAVRGYGYGIEGRNTTTPANDVLAFGSFVNVSRFSQFSLPVKFSSTEQTAIKVTSYPDQNLKFVSTFSAFTGNSSTSIIRNIFIVVAQAGSDNRIEIKKNNVLIHSLNVVQEQRYTPFDVYFLNKYGQLYPITFFKEKINTLKVSDDKYLSSRGQAKDGFHQITTYNKKANREFKAKTGFILEENNEIISQLLLSDKVWILEGGLFNPVNVTTSSLEEQTRQKDRLLNYELSFEYAYNEINDI